MHIPTVVGALAMLASPLSPIAAQERTARDSTRALVSDPAPFSFYSRPSHFLVKWPDGAMYEGNVNIPVYLYSRTAALRSFLGQEELHRSSACRPWSELKFSSGKEHKFSATGCTLTFIPHFVVRQLTSESAPVRTPSFNPTLEFSLLRIAAHRDSAQQTPDRNGSAWVTAITGRVAHYSNGQSGCFFAASVQQPDGGCPPPTGGDRTLNETDGSFSTNYIEGAFTYGAVRFAADGFDRQVTLGSLAVRWHPPGLGMDDDLASLYGRYGVIGRVETRRAFNLGNPSSWLGHREQLVVSVEEEWAGKRPAGINEGRGALEAALVLPGAYGFGATARYAWGWDYYNIAFTKQVPKRLGVGITLRHALSTRFDELWRGTTRR